MFSLIELVKHFGSLTLFPKAEAGLLILLMPCLIWD